jgi:hypothetical protein
MQSTIFFQSYRIQNAAIPHVLASGVCNLVEQHAPGEERNRLGGEGDEAIFTRGMQGA